MCKALCLKCATAARGAQSCSRLPFPIGSQKEWRDMRSIGRALQHPFLLVQSFGGSCLRGYMTPNQLPGGTLRPLPSPTPRPSQGGQNLFLLVQEIWRSCLSGHNHRVIHMSPRVAPSLESCLFQDYKTFSYWSTVLGRIFLKGHKSPPSKTPGNPKSLLWAGGLGLGLLLREERLPGQRGWTSGKKWQLNKGIYFLLLIVIPTALYGQGRGKEWD